MSEVAGNSSVLFLAMFMILLALAVVCPVVVGLVLWLGCGDKTKSRKQSPSRQEPPVRVRVTRRQSV